MSRPVAVVVGAGDYIGAAIAKRFARGGFQVVLGRRNGDRLAPLVEEIEAAGGVAHARTWDARKEEVAEAMFAKIEAEIGPVEIVIFNVGGNVRFPFLETTERVFRKVWELCCFAGFFTGREAAKHMVPRGRGSIFFTGATASMRGGSGYAAFAAGKFALRGMVQALAREMGPKGIHVAHLIIDAGVDTAFVRERMREAGGDPEAMPPDTLMNPDSVAEAYWTLHHQTRDGWTHELDLRPYAETW